MKTSRPSRPTLARLARILDARLRDTHLERVWRPSETTLLVDLRALGKRRLFMSLDTRHPWIAVTERWPETPAAPDRETLVLRKCLEGARVTGVTLEDDRRLVMSFAPRHGHQPVLAIQLAGRYANAAVLDRAGEGETELVRLIAARPGIDPDSPPLSSHEDTAQDDDEAFLARLADAAWAAEDARRLEAYRSSLLRALRAGLARKTRTRDALAADLARAREAERLREEGELLKSALHRVKKGMDAIDVTDYASGEPRALTIALDRTLGPADNLQRIFSRYRKLVRGQEAIGERLERAEAEVTAFARLLPELEAAADEARLTALEAELRALGVRTTGTTAAPHAAQAAPSGRAEPPARKPYRRFLACDGAEILVGKSARDNDDLTFHVARGSDLFLHARDVPGSHVILRRQGRAEPSSEALLDAATLAAWTSQLRGEPVIDVLHTEKKHVRKPRGAAPGLVQTAAAKTITVRVDPERIERLYATLDPHDRIARTH